VTQTPTCPACYEYEISNVGMGNGTYSMVLCDGTMYTITVVGTHTGCLKEGSTTLVSGIQGVITQGINCGSTCLYI
jgi:hypothetical protein